MLDYMNNSLKKCLVCGYMLLNLFLISPVCPNCNTKIPDDPPEHNYVIRFNHHQIVKVSGSTTSIVAGAEYIRVDQTFIEAKFE